ncbi:MAG: bifunctional hydroxymethylpyrimidine kinase/phosphomethylpyrimidine kinase [Lachnospiraceae bacterium]|jgi:pseudouridine kinase|nr:bifunctional hydroxymethylpyrimidine kinase/phosphomethylpyrimidine kinase [Lachnospiraceae bacterium]
MGIVVIGATFVDVKGYPLAQYIPGGRNVGRVVQVHGGVGRNVVEDIANVELRPTFLSVVDDTGLSDDVVRNLIRHKVEIRYVARRPEGLGTWLAVFDNDGDVIASISRRPDLTAIEDVLDEHGDEIFMQADSIVVEFDVEVPILKKVLDLAEKHSKAVYTVISNMAIAMKRRDLLQRTEALVCNQQEAGMLFTEDYSDVTPDAMKEILVKRVRLSGIPRIIVTMGAKGAVYADLSGESGVCPAMRVNVVDTTGAGDAFFAGVAIGLTYGKTVEEACVIGTKLAASVIASRENVCPRFRPEEFGIEVKAK